MAEKTYGTFVKTENGIQRERIAHSPADAVRFAFDGWREMPAGAVAEPAADKPSDAAPGKAKPAGTPKSSS